LAYKITDTKAGDGETLPEILAEAQAHLPEGWECPSVCTKAARRSSGSTPA